MARVVVGLDPGLTETGLVIMNMGFAVLSEHLIKVQPSAAKRLYDIEQALQKITDPYRLRDIVVFIEGYNYGATYQRESLGELGGVLRRWFYLNNIEYWVIPPNNLKKFVTGTGTANKNFMKKCTKEKWDLSFKSDDVCDAHGLARLGVAVMSSRDLGTGSVIGYNTDDEWNVVHEIFKNEDHYKGANTAARNSKKKTNAKR